jgi:hypothetical protein
MFPFCHEKMPIKKNYYNKIKELVTHGHGHRSPNRAMNYYYYFLSFFFSWGGGGGGGGGHYYLFDRSDRKH